MCGWYFFALIGDNPMNNIIYHRHNILDRVHIYGVILSGVEDKKEQNPGKVRY